MVSTFRSRPRTQVQWWLSDRPSSLLPTIIVDDPRAVSGPLCAWFHGSPSHEVRIFGVTGTNGKTSTSHFLDAGMAAAGETAGLISGAAIRGPGTCPVRDPSPDVYADRMASDCSGSLFVAHTPFGDLPIRLQVLGPHQIPNALVALTRLLADQLDPAAVAEGISSLRAIPGRCEPVHAGWLRIAIVDYMHDQSSQRALLPFLRSLADRRLILVIGATGGCDASKRGPLGYSAAFFADLVIVTDESPNDEDPAAIRAEILAGAHRLCHAVR